MVLKIPDYAGVPESIKCRILKGGFDKAYCFHKPVVEVFFSKGRTVLLFLLSTVI
jgi:hypothetical protein